MQIGAVLPPREMVVFRELTILEPRLACCCLRAGKRKYAKGRLVLWTERVGLMLTAATRAIELQILHFPGPQRVAHGV